MGGRVRRRRHTRVTAEARIEYRASVHCKSAPISEPLSPCATHLLPHTAQATTQTIHDWALFVKLEAANAWEAEWLRILDMPRPLAKFRPADVVAFPLPGPGPHQFWLPGGKQHRMPPGARAAQVAEDAWAEAADAEAASDNDIDEVASEEGDPEDKDDGEAPVPQHVMHALLERLGMEC